jgi:hypothetical protein
MIERLWVVLKLRVGFENHVILVELRVHRVDLPLPECIVERVIDSGWSDAEAGCCCTIDDERHGQAPRLLIGGNVFKFFQRL